MDDTRQGMREDEEAPMWIEELIGMTQLPAEFDRRCRNASQAAYAIDRMRRERPYHQIAKLPFDRYIRGLAELAGVALREVQESLDLPAWDRVTAGTASRLARLARLIELPVRETEGQIRWSLLAGIHPDRSEAIQAAYRGALAPIPLDQTLQQAEGAYDPEQRAELDRILQAIREEYGQEG